MLLVRDGPLPQPFCRLTRSRFLARPRVQSPLVVRGALLAPLLELGEAAAEVLELLVLEDDDVRGHGLDEAAVVGHEQYRRRRRLLREEPLLES